MIGLLLPLASYLPILSLAATAAPVECTLSQTKFFILPPWWEYLTGRLDPLGQCAPVFNFPTDIWAVGLAVLDMLIRLAGFVAVVSIILAGVQFITAAGNTDKITAARRRILNALIGLAIASVATAVVVFIGRYFGS